MDISERTWRKLLREIRNSNQNLTRRQITYLDSLIQTSMASSTGTGTGSGTGSGSSTGSSTGTGSAVNTFTFQGLSKWSTVGLTLTDTGFSKLHNKESHYEKEKKKYDLSAETFRTYTRNLIEKVERIHAVSDFQVNIRTGKDAYVLKEYTSIANTMMNANRDARWPDATPAGITNQDQANRFTDSQIKTSVIGNYIHESLTEEAKMQLHADSDLFKVTDLNGEHYYDGPSYFHCIARLVDPDNGHLVAKAKTEIRNLNVKNFGFDIKKMLAEFKNMKTRISDLGGEYSRDDQFLDLWNSVRTLKEKEFTRFVRQLRDEEARKDVTAREPIENIIRDICAKQTRMEVDNEWNVMSEEDNIIVSLMGLVQSTNGSGKSKKNKNNPSTTSGEHGGSKRKPYTVPEWKKEPPAPGASKTKIVDDRTYNWCSKCRDGQGMWALHHENAHVDNFKRNKSNASGESQTTSKKAVSFSVASDNTVDSSDDDNDGPKLQVKEDLFNNAKAYIAQFTDFHKGGA